MYYRKFVPRCKFCFYPLSRDSVVGNSVICKHCCSSYTIIQTKSHAGPLFIALVFTVTFAFHLLWSKGYLNEWTESLSSGVETSSNIRR